MRSRKCCSNRLLASSSRLRRRLQVDLGADDVLMAEIRRQRRQLGVDIDALVGPGRETMNGEGVAELVRTRTDTAVAGLMPS